MLTVSAEEEEEVVATEEQQKEETMEAQNTEAEIKTENEEKPTESETTAQEAPKTVSEEIKEENATETAKAAAKIVSKENEIYIGNLPYTCGETEIREYFAQFGEISNLTLPVSRRKNTKQTHRGFAFICYSDPKISNTVVEMKDHKLGERELNVIFAKPRSIKLFVGAINKEKTTEESLKTYFSQFGTITDVYCNTSDGYGFITINENGENVKKILETKNFEIDGNTVNVQRSKKRRNGGRGGRGGRRGGRGRGRGWQGNTGRTGLPLGGYQQAYAAWAAHASQYSGGAHMFHPYW